jgi:ribonucleoside-diphosphate reductase alpha chain
VKADIQGTNVYYTFSRFADGKIAEVFVDVQRAGTALRGAMSALSLAISVGLQHGTPLQVYIDGLRGIDFVPQGIVTGPDEIKTCTSIIDYLVKALEIEARGAPLQEGP